MILVYPACAGIDPAWFFYASTRTRLPRMRGDRPPGPHYRELVLPFTPHARGSTRVFPLHPIDRAVYPACAGIDPHLSSSPNTSLCLPRMRGDRPAQLSSVILAILFTPHARGSTADFCSSAISSAVYPACAGIDRRWGKTKNSGDCLPRMRGDRPCFMVKNLRVTLFTACADRPCSNCLTISHTAIPHARIDL